MPVVERIGQLPFGGIAVRRISAAFGAAMLLAAPALAQVTPGVPLGTNTVFGKTRGDGTTISCVAGICGTVAGSAGLVVGTTPITGGATGRLLYDNAGVLGEIALGTGVSTFLTTPSSANLRGALTDETGTGLAYFQGGDLGTPSAGVATNLTGTAPALTAGTVTTNANLTGPVTSTGNATAIATAAITQTMVAPATLATGTSVSLTAPRQYYVCTGTCAVTPPVPAAGYEFCILADDNVAAVITLAALGSSARYEATARTSYGTAGTGTFVSGGAVGDKVCLVGRDTTHYLTASFTGTWTVN